MEASPWYYFWIIVLILFSAFFSGSEAALLSVSRIALRSIIGERVKTAEKILKLKQDPARFIGALLVGNNIVNILATSLSTRLLILMVGPNKAIFLSTAILTIIIVIFGEMLPKIVGTSNPTKISLLVYYPVVFFIYILYPIVFLITKLSELILKILRIKTDKKGLISNQQELEAVIDVSQEEGIIEEEEQEMIKSVFEFGDTHVYEIMVPRVDMVCIDVEENITGFLKVVGETGYSRIPIYEDSIDNIIGIVYSKDVMSKIGKGIDIKNLNIKEIMRKAEFVPDSKKVDELFREMRDKKQHMMIVIDEYGGVCGLVTLEDIIEELVGEIQDEYDTEEPFFKEKEDGSYEVAGNFPIDDLDELIGIDLSSEEYDTVSGFLLSSLGHIPNVGEKVFYEGYTFTVDQIKNRRIIKVNVKKEETNKSEDSNS
jgi:CBS domain containing-hemolysin-like protein